MEERVAAAAIEIDARPSQKSRRQGDAMMGLYQRDRPRLHAACELYQKEVMSAVTDSVGGRQKHQSLAIGISPSAGCISRLH